jgi:hypothetical protein
VSEHKITGFSCLPPAPPQPDLITIGKNPENPIGYWPTKEQAVEAFAFQFKDLAIRAVVLENYLEVHKFPELTQTKVVDEETKNWNDANWRMIGIFRLKEKS